VSFVPGTWEPLGREEEGEDDDDEEEEGVGEEERLGLRTKEKSFFQYVDDFPRSQGAPTVFNAMSVEVRVEGGGGGGGGGERGKREESKMCVHIYIYTYICVYALCKSTSM